jgi:phosphatidylglycerol:prolipoprotein diacylglycerol transferase
MHPELFEIPLIHATVKSYGLMIVIGILAAIFVIRKLSDRIGQASVNKDYITNGALYALIAGVIGSRIFYIVHHYNQFRGDLTSVFAIWKGGLELLGGVILAITVIFTYLIILKLPVRRYLDILAIGIVLTLAFGRIGCLMNGCCYGKPTNAAWGIRFPYNSLSYWSQIRPDPDRGRTQPYFELPSKYFGSVSDDGRWIESDPAYKYYADLKPLYLMTPEERAEVTTGMYQALRVHPTQLYSSAKGFILCGLLFSFWRFVGYGQDGRAPRFNIGKPGTTFALMFMLYAVGRFLIEFVRDDNPFEMMGLTISQLISVGLFGLGIALFLLFYYMKPDEIMLTAHYGKPRMKPDQKVSGSVN